MLQERRRAATSGAVGRPEPRTNRFATGRSPAASGFTTIELIIVVAVIGVLLAIGFVRFRTPSTRLFANDLKAQLQEAKYEAVKRNAPVAVVWEATDQVFRTLFDPSLSAPCTGSTVLTVSQAEDYPRLSISSTMSPGVVWLPNGRGVTCTNGAGIESTTTITDGRNTRLVKVELGGGITIQ